MKPLSLLLIILLSMPAALLAADTADTNKPLIVVIGNSMQDEGIHFPTLEKGLNAQIENVWISGSASCWKFAKLWHYIHHWEKQGLTRKPDYVVVISRENFITHTARRTTHEYVEPIAEAIDGDKDLQAIIDSVLKIGAGRYSTWDFDSVIENSFLHQMILAADSAGVQFIFARHRVEKDARNPFWSDSCGGREYRDSLAKYLKSHNVPFLDYSLNPELMVEYYNIGDHLFWPGKTAWTYQMIKDLGAIILGWNAFNDCTKKSNYVFPSIHYLPAIDTAGEGDTIELIAPNAPSTMWSFLDTCNDNGERYLGHGLINKFIIPSGRTVPRTLFLYAYGEYGKWRGAINITNGKTPQNPLPKICAGPDKALLPGETCDLAGTLLDTLQMIIDSLQFWWEVIEGNAIFTDYQSLVTKVTLADTGRAFIRLYVSDGDHINYDDVVLNACDSGEINILCPLGTTQACSGDTLCIRWEAHGVKDAVVEYSLDGGLSWNQYREIIMLDSPEWGNVKWIIPDNIAPSKEALIRISSYDQKVWAFSDAFEIRESVAIRQRPEYSIYQLPESAFSIYSCNGRRIGKHSAFPGTSLTPLLKKANMSSQIIIIRPIAGGMRAQKLPTIR